MKKSIFTPLAVAALILFGLISTLPSACQTPPPVKPDEAQVLDIQNQEQLAPGEQTLPNPIISDLKFASMEPVDVPAREQPTEEPVSLLSFMPEINESNPITDSNLILNILQELLTKSDAVFTQAGWYVIRNFNPVRQRLNVNMFHLSENSLKCDAVMKMSDFGGGWSYGRAQLEGGPMLDWDGINEAKAWDIGEIECGPKLVYSLGAGSHGFQQDIAGEFAYTVQLLAELAESSYYPSLWFALEDGKEIVVFREYIPNMGVGGYHYEDINDPNPVALVSRDDLLYFDFATGLPYRSVDKTGLADGRVLESEFSLLVEYFQNLPPELQGLLEKVQNTEYDTIHPWR